MPFVSKTVEVAANAETILAIVADFESYPEWNDGVQGLWVLARYDDGRPSQLRLDAKYEAIEDSLIQAVYYPSPTQIQTVLQQGNLFKKQEQLFSVVDTGSSVAADRGLGRRAVVADTRTDGEAVGRQRVGLPRREPQEARRGPGVVKLTSPRFRCFATVR